MSCSATRHHAEPQKHCHLSFFSIFKTRLSTRTVTAETVFILRALFRIFMCISIHCLGSTETAKNFGRALWRKSEGQREISDPQFDLIYDTSDWIRDIPSIFSSEA
jgi:hypothetical protein